MTTSEIRDCLRKRYAPPSWAFFEEVRDRTGWASRSADALAFGLWPSQGLELVGFEIKASRGDWLREVKRPWKADRIFSYCDRVVIVAGEKGLVRLDELPPLWGLLEPAGAQLRMTRAPGKNPETRPLDRAFFASLMREAYRYIDQEIRGADRTKEAEARGRKDAEDRLAMQVKEASQRAVDLARAIAEFEKASGIQISTWDAGHVGRELNAFMASRQVNFQHRLELLRTDIDQALAHFNGSGE